MLAIEFARVEVEHGQRPKPAAIDEPGAYEVVEPGTVLNTESTRSIT